MTERLYIVDGHGYIFRAHYGLMNVSRGDGGQSDVVNFDRMITRDLMDESPE